MDPAAVRTDGEPGSRFSRELTNERSKKARAARDDRDLDDLWVLCQVLQIRTTSEVWQICDDVWGEDMIREDVLDLVTSDLRARGLR